MKRVLKTAVFALCLAIYAQAATVPVQNMTPFSLGAEYMHTLNGHLGLYSFDSSALGSHFLRLHYAPSQWLRFSVGIGGSVSYAEPHIKGSKANTSATAGFGVYIPHLTDFMSLTAGYDGYYLRASERRDIVHATPNYDADNNPIDSTYIGYIREGYTAAALHTPYLGLTFHAGRHVDIEVGALYHYFDIIKKNREHGQGRLDRTHNTILIDEINPEPGHYYIIEDMDSRGIDKTMDQVRVYSTLTLHERVSGAYLSGGFSYALTNQYSEGRSHLTDISFWAQVGLIMKESKTPSRRAGRSKYGSSYAELSARQSLMAAELNRDVTRDRQRIAEERKAVSRCRNHKHDEQGNCMVDKDGNYIPRDEEQGGEGETEE